MYMIASWILFLISVSHSYTNTHTHTHTLCVQHQWLNPGHNPANVRHILTSFQWNFKRFHIWTVFLHSVCVSNAHKNLLCTLTAHSRVFIEECPYIGVGGRSKIRYDYNTITKLKYNSDIQLHFCELMYLKEMSWYPRSGKIHGGKGGEEFF